jgi:hypothetical protein
VTDKQWGQAREVRERHSQFHLPFIIGQNRDIAQFRAVLRHGARIIGMHPFQVKDLSAFWMPKPCPLSR